MSHSHRRDLRARGGRVSVDHLIAQSAKDVYRLNRDDFFDLCDAVRANTSLLSHQRIGEIRCLCSIPQVLMGLRWLSEYRYRFCRSLYCMKDLRHWPLTMQWLGFVRHLVEPYPLPEFLSYDWLASTSETWGRVSHLKLADGISRKQIELPDGTFANKVVARHFMQAPHDASPMGALRYSQVMALSDQARREPSVSHSRFAMKWIGFGDDHDVNLFWEGMIRWIERERPAIEFLKEFYSAVVTARFRPAADEFGIAYPNRIIDGDIDIASWSLRRAKRFLVNWREDYIAQFAGQVRQPPSRHRPWRKLGIPDARFTLADDRSVEVVQLNTPYQLSVEGARQLHCVGSYSKACRHGRSAIFSLRIATGAKMQRRLTIEVKPAEYAVKTVLGKANREPSEEEWRWVRIWARHQCLEVSC